MFARCDQRALHAINFYRTSTFTLTTVKKVCSYRPLQNVIIVKHVILLYVSVFSAHLLVLSGVQVSNLVPVQQKPCYAVLDKQNSQGYDCNQGQTTSGRCASNYSRRLLACIYM